jgi:HlyD family secretion protein
VAATGTLQAVTSVQVGTQVSGTIAWLGADFNSIVRKGQAIARLDPSLFETQVEQARANLAKATAELDNAQVRAADAQQKYDRAQELAARQLLARSDLEAAKLAVDTADATVRSTRAQLLQAEAALNQSQLNLAHTVITAPIDGIVIARSVDVGQTVAASLSSPTVFSIAADLTEMQLSASIDESDIGRIRPAQRVSFDVDAYPNRRFTGTVVQVRLQPNVVQNVTTYNVIIDVPNEELLLKPGMTANVGIEIVSRDDVVRVPNAALRFRPTADTFAALGQPPVDVVQAARANRQGAVSAEAVPVPAERRLPIAAKADASGATTVDALFGALDIQETEGIVWTYANDELQPVRVRLGVTDGQVTELLDGGLEPGTPLVTTVATGQTATPVRPTTPAGGLFMPGPAGPGNRRGG